MVIAGKCSGRYLEVGRPRYQQQAQRKPKQSNSQQLHDLMRQSLSRRSFRLWLTCSFKQ
jgi:hypothetical protein